MMEQVHFLDYINKILLLEKQVGSKIGYKMLEPFSVNTTNIIDIQKAAKTISDFVGLVNYTFVVSFSKQEPHTAGRIDINSKTTDSFIELSPEERTSEHTLLTTLSHEITHKFLNVENVSCIDSNVYRKENEVLTDIAAVFLGLGKLMLNGCETISVRVDTNQNERKTTTTTYKRGYLDINQLSSVYLLICSMRRISADDYNMGLSNIAFQRVNLCSRNFNIFFNDVYHNNDIKNKLYDRFKDTVRESQGYLADITKYKHTIHHLLINYIENYTCESHKKILSFDDRLQKSCNHKEYDPCSKYLDAVLYNMKIKSVIDEFNIKANNEIKMLEILSKIYEIVACSELTSHTPSMVSHLTVKCPIDGTLLKIPDINSLLRIKCPICNYSFIVNSGDVVVDRLQDSMKKKKLRTGLLSKLKNILHK